jgi:hypothetical protein
MSPLGSVVKEAGGFLSVDPEQVARGGSVIGVFFVEQASLAIL